VALTKRAIGLGPLLRQGRLSSVAMLRCVELYKRRPPIFYDVGS